MATKYRIIDVSSWQGDIDWNKVRSGGVVGAIIRYADGLTIDNRFKQNMTGEQFVSELRRAGISRCCGSVIRPIGELNSFEVIHELNTAALDFRNDPLDGAGAMIRNGVENYSS